LLRHSNTLPRDGGDVNLKTCRAGNFGHAETASKNAEFPEKYAQNSEKQKEKVISVSKKRREYCKAAPLPTVIRQILFPGLPVRKSEKAGIFGKIAGFDRFILFAQYFSEKKEKLGERKYHFLHIVN